MGTTNRSNKGTSNENQRKENNHKILIIRI